METKNKEQLYEFLIELDEKYIVAKTHTLSIKTLMSIGSTYRLASEDEKQRHIYVLRRTNPETMAFQVQNVKNDKDETKEKPQCRHCQKFGHTEDKCYEIIGYPFNWREPNRDRQDVSGSWNDRHNGLNVAYANTTEIPIFGLTLPQYEPMNAKLNRTGRFRPGTGHWTGSVEGAKSDGIDPG